MSLGLFIALVLFLPLPSKASGALRRNWVFEQLSLSPAPSSLDGNSGQIGLSATHFKGIISAELASSVSLQSLDISLKAGQRATLLETSSEPFFEGEKRSLSLRITRRYLSPSRYFGRIGGGLIQFFPETGLRWGVLSVGTGILNSPAFPWSLDLSLSCFFKWILNTADLASRRANFIVASIETLRDYWYWPATTVKGGILVSWTYQPDGETPSLNKSTEHMLISFGPVAVLETKFGILGGGLKWRVWLDRELISVNDQILSSYPSDISVFPDLALAFRAQF